jgi:hypothetical protein
MPKTWKRVGVMFNIKFKIMKKFRMMLPVLAVVFAFASAFGGSFLPQVQAHWKTGPVTCSPGMKLTKQNTCDINLDVNFPVCTIVDDNNIEQQAYLNGCSQVLRYIP